ncbi:hypothetical protein [Mycolicibacterium sp.]|uniref:hypothetical protein n=1 Tax=Mycolicibacterium sp. TaxID=2320850 RepID=UPI0037C80E3B
MNGKLDGPGHELGEELDEASNDSMEEIRLIGVTEKDMGGRFSSADDIVMTGLYKAARWNQGVYRGGDAIMRVDNGTLIPDLDQFINEQIESTRRIRRLIAEATGGADEASDQS